MGNRNNKYGILVPDGTGGDTAPDKFEEFIINATWESSDPADDVLYRLGFTNGRGINNLWNKHLKNLVLKGVKFASGLFTKQLGLAVNAVGSVTGLKDIGKISPDKLLEDQLISQLDDVGFKTYAPSDDLSGIRDAITPILNSKGHHHWVLWKRLNKGLCAGWQYYEAGDFTSSAEAKTALGHLLALQLIIKEDIFNGKFHGLRMPVQAMSSDYYKQHVWGMLRNGEQGITKAQINYVCNFASLFVYTTDPAEYDNFLAELNELNNDNAQQTTVEQAKIGNLIGLAGLGALILKGKLL